MNLQWSLYVLTPLGSFWYLFSHQHLIEGGVHSSIVSLDFYLGGTLSLEWRYSSGPEEGRNMSTTLL